MQENLDSQLEIDRQKIRNSVQLQIPVEVTSYTLPRNKEVYCRKVLNVFLEECHQEHMKEYLDFCLGELLTNAKKANTKRIYFKEKNLDIFNPDDYQEGMKTFKEDTLSNIDYYLDLQKKEGLYIKLLLQLTNENIKIEIRNNSVITPFEKERIDVRIENALKYKSAEEIIMNVLDQSEGAGLGIMIIILMLQRIGLTKECYQFTATETETVTSIILPCNKMLFAGIEAMSYEFVFLQNTIPVLKDNFTQLQKIISEPKINRTDFLNFVSNDVTLSVLLLNEVLKTDKNCINLQKAAALLTDDQIRFVYSETNPELTFIEPESENQVLWNHGKKVAYYAFNIWKNLKKGDDDSARELFTMGLMSSLGNIFLKNQNEDQKSCMAELSEQYDETEKIRDLFLTGSSSPYISYIYAKIHGYPEQLYYTVGKWNCVDDLLEGEEDYIFVIYLAEILAYYNEGIIDFYQIKTSVLEHFGLNTKEKFLFIANRLKNI